MGDTGREPLINSRNHVQRSCLKTSSDGELNGIEKKSKTVHFADTCGMVLTSVRIFDHSDEIYGCNCKQEFGLTLHRFLRNNTQGFASKQPRQRNRLLNFVQPCTLQYFKDKVESNAVSLENIVFRPYSIYGTVVVSNITFDKRVCVRYTTNSWKSSYEVVGKYHNGTSNGKTDTFSFEIPFPSSGSESEVKFELAIKYEALDEIFWDNNYGENYQVLCFTEPKLEKNKNEETEKLDIYRQKLSLPSDSLGLCRIRRLPMLKSMSR